MSNAGVSPAPQVGDVWRFVTRSPIPIDSRTVAYDVAKSIGGNEVAVVLTSANIQNKLFLIEPGGDPSSWLGRLPVAQVLGIWDTGGNK